MNRVGFADISILVEHQIFMNYEYLMSVQCFHYNCLNIPQLINHVIDLVTNSAWIPLNCL